VKKLIIILALVGVSFIGLLIYGGGRSQEPKRPCEQVTKDDKGEYTVPDSWCPPSLADSTRGLQARFGPGLGQGVQTIDIGPQSAPPATVDAKFGTKVRTAKLTLKSGNFALAKGTYGDGVVCLCQEGAPIPPNFRAQCDAHWKKENAGAASCVGGFNRATLPFDQFGGSINFTVTGMPATVEVK